MAKITVVASNPSLALVTPGHPYVAAAGSGVAGVVQKADAPVASVLAKAQTQHSAGTTGRID